MMSKSLHAQVHKLGKLVGKNDQEVTHKNRTPSPVLGLFASMPWCLSTWSQGPLYWAACPWEADRSLPLIILAPAASCSPCLLSSQLGCGILWGRSALRGPGAYSHFNKDGARGRVDNRSALETALLPEDAMPITLRSY